MKFRVNGGGEVSRTISKLLHVKRQEKEYEDRDLIRSVSSNCRHVSQKVSSDRDKIGTTFSRITCTVTTVNPSFHYNLCLFSDSENRNVHKKKKKSGKICISLSVTTIQGKKSEENSTFRLLKF